MNHCEMYLCGPECKALFSFSSPLQQASKETYIYSHGSERVYVQKQNIFVKVSRFSRWMLLKIVSRVRTT